LSAGSDLGKTRISRSSFKRLGDGAPWFATFDIALRNFYRAQEHDWRWNAIDEGVTLDYEQFAIFYQKATGEMYDYGCHHVLCRHCGHALPGKIQWGQFLGRCEQCDQAIRELNTAPKPPQKSEGAILVAAPIQVSAGQAPRENPRVPVSWFEDLAGSAEVARNWAVAYGD
jgi:hypothetical protein